MSGRVDHPDRVGASLAEPEVAIGARRDSRTTGTGDWVGKQADGVSRRVDHPDRVGAGIGEPDVAVGTRRDPRDGFTQRATAWEGELGDGGNAREQATIFQPFEPKDAPLDTAPMPGWSC